MLTVLIVASWTLSSVGEVSAVGSAVGEVSAVGSAVGEVSLDNRTCVLVWSKSYIRSYADCRVLVITIG